MTTKIHLQTTLEVNVCAECGITFAAPEGFWSERERDGRIWYCPNGHQRVYRETVEQQLRRELQQKEERLQRVRQDRDRYRDQADAEARSHAATRGHLTRTRRRAAAAVCPVDGCKRTIQQMARHLRTKHPDYRPAEA
jgi:hypothetical protein